MVRVDLSPGDPRVRAQQDVSDDSFDAQGDGEAKIDGSYSNETPVSAVCQVGVGVDEIPELLPPLDESADGESWT